MKLNISQETRDPWAPKKGALPKLKAADQITARMLQNIKILIKIPFEDVLTVFDFAI